MLKESTQRPSALRKYDEDNNLKETSNLKGSQGSSTSKLEDDLKGSHTMKFFQNVQSSFEPIESELQRIREILDKEK